MLSIYDPFAIGEEMLNTKAEAKLYMRKNNPSVYESKLLHINRNKFLESIPVLTMQLERSSSYFTRQFPILWTCY